MHGLMNTEEKLSKLKAFVGDKEILASVGGNFEVKQTDDEMRRGFWAHLMNPTGVGNYGQGMSAGGGVKYTGPKTRNLTTENVNGQNFYMALTDKELHFVTLVSYDPGLTQGRFSIPLDQISNMEVKSGTPHYVKFDYDGQHVILMIPSKKSFTHLKDQKESAEQMVNMLKVLSNECTRNN